MISMEQLNCLLKTIMLKVQPYIQVSSIQVSIFNESLLNLMYEKAMKQTFGEIDWDTVFKYGMAILQMVVAPTAVFTCGISFYAIMRSICRRRKGHYAITPQLLRK